MLGSMFRPRARTFLMPGKGWVMSLNAFMVKEARIEVWVYFRSDMPISFLIETLYIMVSVDY